ncbi:MAG: serine hydrolase domain-containing protein, partial [Gaiellaceae bacterium]
PGTRWSYSNTNYVVAQLILEKATGHTIGTELKHRIFQPLRLRSTIYPTKPGLPSPYAHGYRDFGKPPLVDVTGLSPSLAPGSGAIVSTVRDVADFYRALLAGRLLEPKELQGMKTTVSELTGKVVPSGPGYGLGIARSGVARPSVAVNVSCAGWGHTGELAGYDVSAVFSENGRRQAVLMINQDASTLPEPARALYGRLIGKAFCAGA